MLAKLSVLLGFLIAVTLGQAPDCEKKPRMRGLCCANVLQIAEDYDDGGCDITSKVGDVPTPCTHLTCIMKKNDYLLANNKIDRAALTKFVKQNLTDYAPNIETLLEKCYTDTETSKCTPVAFLTCAGNILMKECPSASWEKSEECTVLKNYFNNCPNAEVFHNFVD